MTTLVRAAPGAPTAPPPPGALRFAGICAQLAAVLWMAHWLRIEPASGLPRVLPLVFVGFVVHARLPLAARLPFFLLLSGVAFALVLGTAGAAALVGAGLLLIGACHVPLAFGARVALVAALGTLLAAVHGGWLALGGGTGLDALPALVLPVLGSMFMFRLILYLYDLRHEERDRARLGAAAPPPASPWARLSYFFLLPNVCFPLFPIVDWRTFRRTYYGADALAIYQRGVWWICLGLIHLVAYRFVYHYLVPLPEEVRGVGGVVRFTTSSYLVYLRVVGQFHLIVGLLCLFGFDLPPAHRMLFLAAGFTDFWRRVRIEWKDFMVKVFYFPVLVPAQRRWGVTPALVLGTVAVFVATWLLHAYQWFWLRGELRLSASDTVFWSLIGGCVLANSLLEARRPRRAAVRGGDDAAPGPALAHALRVLGVFAFMCVAWSYWSSPSFGFWWSVVSAAEESGPAAWLALFAGLALVVAVGAAVRLAWLRGGTGRTPAPRADAASAGWRPAAVVAATAAMLLIGVPADRGALGDPALQLAGTLRSNRLNALDEDRETRGYYDALIEEPGSAGAALASARSSAPASAARTGAPGEDEVRRRMGALGNQDFVRLTGDLLAYELVPSFTGSYRGAEFRTNRFGLRDREYAATPPPGTYRIALLGSSYTMGPGVPVDRTHEWLVEERLNREGPEVPERRYEILNFSVGGYGLLQEMLVAERKVFAHEPDAVVLMVHSIEVFRMANHLTAFVEPDAVVDAPYVRELLDGAGVGPGMERPELVRRLNEIAPELTRWSLRRVAELAAERGVPALAVLFPEPREEASGFMARMERLEGWARDAGLTVLTLPDAYGDHAPEEVWLGSDDPHLNELGHRLIADALWEALRRSDADGLRLGFERLP